MSFSLFKHACLTGLTVSLPEKEICIYDELQYYGNSRKKVDRLHEVIGFYKRRVADKLTTPSDLAICAAEKLIKELKINRQDIDALIYVCQKPDFRAPATAYFIHNKLGLSQACIAADINQGCAGFVFGCLFAFTMAESGNFKKILLLNADTPSVGIEAADRVNAPLFSDAGSAALIEYSEEKSESYFYTETASDSYECILAPFSGARACMQLSSDADFKFLDGIRKESVCCRSGKKSSLLFHNNTLKEFATSLELVPRAIENLLKYAGRTKESISALCMNQVNKQTILAIGESLELPEEKTPYKAFELYSNNTMCSVPCCIMTLKPEIDKSKLCLCSFGNGFAAASAFIDLKDCLITEPVTYTRASYVLDRDDYVDYWRNKIKDS